MRKLIVPSVFLLIAFLFVYATICYSKPHSEVAKTSIPIRKYISPTPGYFPIVATTVYPDTSEPTYKDFKQAADAGFNVIIQNSTTALFEKALPLIDSVGMKLIMSNGEISAYDEVRCRQFVDHFRNYPAVGGWMLVDEPPYNKLNDYSSRYNLLCNLDTDRLIFMNLVGVASKYFGGPDSKNIKDYLNLIRSKFNPMLWSYDYYPIWEKNGKVEVNYDGFYDALESYSAMSSETGIPFWAYCMSAGHKTGGNVSPTPTEAYLRFEAFSALGYGAQGIVYWTYYQRPDVPSAGLYYTSAIVNREREKTKVWTYARNVNSEIHALKDVFLGCKLIECVHTGKNLYKNTKRFKGKTGPLESIVSGESGVQVSYLENFGKNYILIVNHDVKGSQDVAFTFSAEYNIERVNPTGKRVAMASNFKQKLPAGGYALFCCIPKQ